MSFIALTPLRYASPYEHDYSLHQAVGDGAFDDPPPLAFSCHAALLPHLRSKTVNLSVGRRLAAPACFLVLTILCGYGKIRKNNVSNGGRIYVGKGN